MDDSAYYGVTGRAWSMSAPGLSRRDAARCRESTATPVRANSSSIRSGRGVLRHQRNSENTLLLSDGLRSEGAGRRTRRRLSRRTPNPPRGTQRWRARRPHLGHRSRRGADNDGESPRTRQLPPAIVSPGFCHFSRIPGLIPYMTIDYCVTSVDFAAEQRISSAHVRNCPRGHLQYR